ncbi:MAG: thymidylate kinase [Clostridia bacterium]|nr:thymidylate kinase [Clostridia bacterium]
MSGRLFVIEGVDGSGKSTQFRLACDVLTQVGTPFRKVTFPRYAEPSSALLRMYLAGEFGKNPTDVGPYAASSFFAVDRYASYKTDWGQAYHSGATVLCDRYTTSNAIHQTVKLPQAEREQYLNWLFDFEYEKMALPRPSKVYFLDMPNDVAQRLITERQGAQGDIHELDHDYLSACREAARAVCARCGWTVIDCVHEGVLRTPEDICREITEDMLKQIRG